MTLFDAFAEQFSDTMGEEGDYYHQTQIDPYIYESIGDPQSRVIYDIGCGNGYMARHFAREGARVYASDASARLIQIAQHRSKGLHVTYAVHDALDFRRYTADMFDAVTMSMVIHYIRDLGTLFRGIARVLKPDGTFVFSTGHMLRPDRPFSESIEGEVNGKKVLFIEVTGYLKRGKRTTISTWDKKTKLTMYNHPLGDLVNTMSKHGLYTYRLMEPEPMGFAQHWPVHLQRSHHIPSFMILAARKLQGVNPPAGSSKCP